MSDGLSINIRRRLDAFRLDVQLETGTGLTGILGPSGAGKSMLLSCVAGLSRPEAGHIHLNGQPLFDHGKRIDLSPEFRGIGYVFQDARLFPHLTVRSNLTYSKRKSEEPPVTFDQVVHLLNLGHLIERRPHHLSGGEKQRVAIGRALLSNPRVLLMDEPLASLDMARRREIMPFLERVHREVGIPILYVSHNLDEIVRLADTVAIMREGKVEAEGPVDTVLSRIDVQNLVMGVDGADGPSEPVTIIRGTVGATDEDGLTELSTPLGHLTASNIHLPQGEEVRLRIRARDIVIATQSPDHLSIQNSFSGEIGTMMEAGPSQVDVLIRVPNHAPSPQALWARITRRAALQLDLKPETPVWALIKAVVLANDATPDDLR